jgi:hypothetical protein
VAGKIIDFVVKHADEGASRDRIQY